MSESLKEHRKKTMERLGELTPDDKKPDWLRNVDGSGPPQKAHWVPATQSGVPTKE